MRVYQFRHLGTGTASYQAVLRVGAGR
jgi:hypothetical protein